MKEFNLVFWNDAAKDLFVTTRNKKPLKMEIFTTSKLAEKELNSLDKTTAASEELKTISYQ
jgi:hypothetical protein